MSQTKVGMSQTKVGMSQTKVGMSQTKPRKWRSTHRVGLHKLAHLRGLYSQTVDYTIADPYVWEHRKHFGIKFCGVGRSLPESGNEASGGIRLEGMFRSLGDTGNECKCSPLRTPCGRAPGCAGVEKIGS